MFKIINLTAKKRVHVVPFTPLDLKLSCNEAFNLAETAKLKAPHI